MKKIIRLCVSALMITAATGVSGQNPKCFSNDSDRRSVVKVMSFNVRFNNPADTADTAWPRRIEPCRRMILNYQPDVVGMQEVRASMEQGAKAIMEGYNMVNVPMSADTPDKKTGPATVFYRKDKFCCLDSGYFWLSATPEVKSAPWNSTDRHYRAAVWTKLQDRATGDVIWFVTTHLPYKKEPVDTEVRAKCCDLIIERMSSIAGDDATLIVTGDMNASWSEEDSRRMSIAPFFAHMHSARDEAEVTDNQSSFNGFGRVIPGVEGKNLDHIFYLNAHPLVFETVNRSVYGDVRWISDHYPIVCTFTY